ncbi:sigma-54-dependent transcriptional regulator [Colwellia psychrerythraea]|uniref:Two component, sigma54 specific, transcriptional regulator, Fis family n=1 Tax=Colwellia psychrerythraea TaxID=28229 RepID=A0A099L235_COLPS|nr:sigma-54 dependent transcriptional regulator [Colwellia psychrerythraea]KGJ97019.1 two component, sigma54 specific, transcriptional regulator, Fis family [Colwellia psychrerythraea]
MTTHKILIVEDDAGLREALVDTLSLAGYDCVEADSGEAALLELKKQQVDIVISDVQMGGMSGLSLLKSIKSQHTNLPVLLMTAYGTIDDAVQAMQDGACNYIAKPFAPQVLLNMVSQYIPLKTVNKKDPIVADKRSLDLLVLAKKVASTAASVMILGPSGSGKEVLAQYVHNHSKRSAQPFIAINCAAIPENMLEATLFGYEKGAFTGAIQACPGKFEQAQGGTILLDEITEMDLSLQAKILRVLQEREVERLGGRKTISLDVRVIATSNRDLKAAVKDGLFREDLYYRLNVFPLSWLPLAQRVDDIFVLAQHLVARHCQNNGDNIPEFTAAARSKLNAYHWPGNVRELDNVIQRALILHTDQLIDAGDLLIENFDTALLTEPEDVSCSDDKLGSELKLQEHQIILDTLHACQGSRKAVAERLGISPRTLRYKIAKMRDSGIEIPA